MQQIDYCHNITYHYHRHHFSVFLQESSFIQSNLLAVSELQRRAGCEKDLKHVLLSLVCHQIVHEKEIQAEDDQVFLVKLQVRKKKSCFFNASWDAACLQH